nr:hypothetical protein [Tanacetum cinerariifolium]
MDRIQKSAHWKVLRIDYGRLYQVDDRRRVHQVDLTFRTCTCRKWRLSASRPKNTDRIKSPREEPIQVRCSRCDVRGHNRTTCHEPIANYQDSTQPRLKRSRQTKEESNIHVDLGGHS